MLVRLVECLAVCSHQVLNGDGGGATDAGVAMDEDLATASNHLIDKFCALVEVLP